MPDKSPRFPLCAIVRHCAPWRTIPNGAPLCAIVRHGGGYIYIPPVAAHNRRSVRGLGDPLLCAIFSAHHSQGVAA